MVLMTYLILVILSVFSFEIVLALKLQNDASALFSTLKQSINLLTSKTMTDEEKESYARSESVKILKATTRFMMKCIMIACSLYALYWVSTINRPIIRDAVVKQLFS